MKKIFLLLITSLAMLMADFTLSGDQLTPVVTELTLTESAPEKVVNGDFSTDTVWNKDTGWSISNGTANVDSTGLSNEWLTQAGILTIGKTYTVTFTVSNYTSGSIGTDSWYPDYTNPGSISSNGVHTLDFTAAKTSFTLIASNNTILSIDNVSVKESNGAGTDIATTEPIVTEPIATNPVPISDGTYTIIPGLYGFGTDTRAAYGGTVDPVILHVNTLASGVSNTDSTHGSFEWAVTRPYPRVVVFDISGVINGVGNLSINSPYLTIAGQTAPGKIVFNGEGFYINAHDVVLQHMIFRNKNTADKDCITINNYGGMDVYNVVIDHCSGSWATDELVSVGKATSYDVRDITISNSIWAECLQTHSTGSLLNAPNISILGNIYAHNNKRHPAANDKTHVAFYNNIIYNYGYAIAEFNGLNSSTQTIVDKIWINFIGNFVKSGANSSSGRGLVLMDNWAQNTTNHISMRDNIHNGVTKTGVDVDTKYYNWPYKVVDEIIVPNYTPYPASLTYDTVMSTAGARPNNRDSVDSRIISEISNGTGSHKSSTPSMPNYPKIVQPFVPVDNPHNMYDAYYTNLEHQLDSLAKALEN